MIKLSELLNETPYEDPNSTTKVKRGNQGVNKQHFDDLISLITDLFKHLSPNGRQFFIDIFTNSSDGGQILGMIHFLEDQNNVKFPGIKRDDERFHGGLYGGNTGSKNRAKQLLQLLSDQTPQDEDVWDIDLSGDNLFDFCILMSKLFQNKTVKKHIFEDIFSFLTKNGQGIIRGHAPIKWISNPLIGTPENEHVVPVLVMKNSLLNMIENNEFNQQNYDLLMSKSFMVRLSEEDNNRLGRSGLGKRMPNGWNWKTDSPWDRYQQARIDPNTIVKINNPNEHPPYSINEEISRIQELAGIKN